MLVGSHLIVVGGKTRVLVMGEGELGALLIGWRLQTIFDCLGNVDCIAAVFFGFDFSVLAIAVLEDVSETTELCREVELTDIIFESVRVGAKMLFLAVVFPDTLKLSLL